MNTQKYSGWLLFVVVLAIGTSCSRQAPVADVEVGVPVIETKVKPESEQCRNEKANIDRLQERNAEFARLPKQSQLTDEPYLKGKMIYLGRNEEGEYVSGPRSDYFLECREAGAKPDPYETVRARSPEEVQTVVVSDCKVAQTAEYIVGSQRVPARSYNCDMTIIDRIIPAVIYKKRFKGEKLNPNEKVTVAIGETEVPLGISKSPDAEMERFILSLPRQ